MVVRRPNPWRHGGRHGRLSCQCRRYSQRPYALAIGKNKDFNLAAALAAHLPRIDGHEVFIQIYSDAVVQGLSDVPNMTDISHWGVMTIGTGVGNARFTNRTDT